jgi:Fe-S-cluster containining protein
MTSSVSGRMGYLNDNHYDLRNMGRTQSNACIAFDGSAGDHCECAIYEERPAVCRDFQRGSRDCLDSIAALEASA